MPYYLHANRTYGRIIMIKDYIVDEVRATRNKLSARFNHNLHDLCEFLRKEEKKHKTGVVSSTKKRRVLKPTS